ncbi:scavenger receptor cysteine-rich type 1 protein M130-like isoform X2 [Haliotis rubra]|uniref:scavenger receptor cysteine-rich type 1 protein M130-like isoform X2 n=1 Tax=Haliotis rubra TaxID=36100 RepID=UPI001EE5A1BE|nr:scavenger receptor cysteine-rich type 1 protein M130-like isoform X2 [Haliotis rubra]
MTKWATAYILLLTSVSCSVFGQTIRLVSPLDNGVGRLEVYYNGTWGTVCDDGFDTDEAKVACRQLGLYKSGVTPRAIQEFGFGGGRIWLDDLSCSGTESSLASCSHGKWGVHDCQHIEDVGIICDPSDITMKLTSYKMDSCRYSTPVAGEQCVMMALEQWKLLLCAGLWGTRLET